jgi:hypothetical protein
MGHDRDGEIVGNSQMSSISSLIADSIPQVKGVAGITFQRPRLLCRRPQRPSVHLRTAGSCSGSCSHLVQTIWSSGTTFIGLPHTGHAFRIGYGAVIGIPLLPQQLRALRGFRLIAEGCLRAAGAGVHWPLDGGGPRVLNSDVGDVCGG